MTNDKNYVLVCEQCAKDIGISPEELSNAIMLPKPLTEEDILIIVDAVNMPDECTNADLIKFAKAIEKEHGIL